MEIFVVVKSSREIKAEYQVKIKVPAVPRIGETITIQRVDNNGDTITHKSEDENLGFYVEQESLIVRDIHWTMAYPKNDTQKSSGKVSEIYVVCDPAIAKYDSPQHKASAGPNAPKIEFM